MLEIGALFLLFVLLYSQRVASQSCETLGELLHHPSDLPCASVSKRVFVQNLSYENEFDLHENEPVGKNNFHTNGFALVLTQTQKATRKWPIELKKTWCVR